MKTSTASELIRIAAGDMSHRQALASVTHQQITRNLACGDAIQVTLLLQDQRLDAMAAQVSGCLVTAASWARLAGAIQSQAMSVDEAKAFLQSYLDFLEKPLPDHVWPESIAILQDFRRPSPRRECASLAAQAIMRCFDSPTGSLIDLATDSPD